MNALLRYPKRERSAVARRWGKLGNEAQQRMRDERGPDADTMRKRALFDAKGQLVREGCTYSATGETQWIVRRSVTGRTDQYDLVANGKTVRTAGARRLPQRFRPDKTLATSHAVPGATDNRHD